MTSPEQEPSLEWDSNATARHLQIVSGIDISYSKVLVPTLLELLGDLHGKSVLDVGCGSGTLSALLARTASLVVGVDASPKMIEIAEREYGGVTSLRFENIDLSNNIRNLSEWMFDSCVSNMALNTMPDLNGVLSSIRHLLRPQAVMAITIPHPWFWHEYKKKVFNGEFDYVNPHADSFPFVISLDETPLPVPTTVFHRPLSVYFDVLLQNGFHIDRLLEPYPPPEVQSLYPQPWRFPRFLALKCHYDPNQHQVNR